MLTPNILDPKVVSFCESVVPGGEPGYVQHAPLTGKPVKECFSIVPEHVRTHGGKQVIGWAILHIPSGVA